MGDPFPRLTPAQVKLRADLHGRRNAKMDEIIAVIARDLGYNAEFLASSEYEDAEEEAEAAIDRWSSEVETAPGASSRQASPLQRLLRDYHSLGEAMLRLSEDVIRKSTQD